MGSSSQVSRRSLRIFAVSAILIAIAIVAVFAYWVFLAPKAGPRVSVVSDPLELSLALDKTDYREGENISITYVLKNIRTENLALTFGAGYGYYNREDKRYHPMYSDFVITDANGTKVYQWGDLSGATLAEVYVPMNPQEEKSNTFTFMSGLNVTTVAGCKLAPGIYEIKGITPAGRLVSVGVQSDTIHTTIKLETRSIRFTIR